MSGLMGFDEAFQAADRAVRAIRADGLRDIERVVLEGSWNRCTYQTIAAQAGYAEGYLSRDVGPALWSLLSDALGVPVKKTNFRTAIEHWSSNQTNGAAPPVAAPSPPAVSLKVTLVEPQAETALPFDVSDFRGRSPLLASLTHWITDERGRLLCLSGLPGVGKTWLAMKLMEQVRPQFQTLMYVDLSDRPTPDQLIHGLLHYFKVSPASDARSAHLDRLVQILSQRRSLIVLDNTAACCTANALAGTYEGEFEAYKQVLSALAHREHQSCIVWVGRELPRLAGAIAGSSCRLEKLTGLQPEEIATLAVWSDNLEATAADWQLLSRQYGGLPALILTAIAPRIGFFRQRLQPCLEALQQEKSAVEAYLKTWLTPLSAAEWHLLRWMTISRRPLSLEQLSEAFAAPLPLGALESLCDRGVCRCIGDTEPAWELALPDLLTPYLCDQHLATFQQADAAAQLAWLQRYPLMQADAPEMVRQWQKQTLLTAVASHLATTLPHPADQRRFLREQLQQSQTWAQQGQETRYLTGNLVNLAQHWQIPLVDMDFHGLHLREADLQSDLCQGAAFAGADLSRTLLAKPMGQCLVMAMHSTSPEIAVGDQDGRILLWNLQDGRLQRALLTVQQSVTAIAYSPDGSLLADARQDGTVRLWDLQSDFAPEQFIYPDEGALTTLMFSPDQQLLVGGDVAGQLHVWRLASGEEIHCIAAHTSSVSAIAISADSRKLLSCGQDCLAIEWDLFTGQAQHRFQGRLTNLLGTVAYQQTAADAAETPLVVGRDDGQLIIWDVISARPLYIMKESCDLFMAIALSPNGRYLAASDVSNTVSIWDVESRTRLCQIAESCAPVEALVFSHDSTELMTGCDYVVQRWQVSSGDCLRIWRSDRHPPRDLALATQPLQLLSNHDDNTLRCWQQSSTRQRWLPQERLQVPNQGQMRAIATSLNGSHWAVGTESGHIYLWDCEQQSWVDWAMRLPKAVTVLQFNGQGTLLAAGDALGTVALWDLPNRIFRWQKVQTHADQVMALAFPPSGQQVYSGSRDRLIKGWDLKGQTCPTMAGHSRRVHTLCSAADGQTLYSGSYDGSVRQWRLADSQCLDRWYPPTTPLPNAGPRRKNAYIYKVVLDARQCAIAIISDTQTVELWDLTTKTCRATFTPHAETIWHLSTSPDGEALVCAAQNGDISLWAIATGDCLGRLRVDRPYEGMQIGGCQGLIDSERQMLYSLGATDY